MGEGVLLDPHAVSGIASPSVDVFRQIGVGVGGDVGDIVVVGATPAEILEVEVGGTKGVSHYQSQVIRVSPCTNVAHVESDDHCVVVQWQASVVLGQVVGAGVLSGEGVVGDSDGRGAGGGESGQTHGGGVGQFVGDDGPLGRQGARSGRGPVGVQVEDAVGAHHAPRRGFVEADPLVVYAGGGAEVPQRGQRHHQQENCQSQQIRHVDQQWIIILIYSLCVKPTLTINTDESHPKRKIKLKESNIGGMGRGALLPQMARIPSLKRVGCRMWTE